MPPGDHDQFIRNEHADWKPEGVRVLERTNGTAAPLPERPNPLRRERWVDMGDLYPGHQVLIRFNPNKKGIEPLPADASEEDKILAGLKLMVRAHRIHFNDGTPDSPWIDPDTNQPLPDPSTDEFYQLISNEQLMIISGHIAVEGKKVRASAERILGGSIDSLSVESQPNKPDPSGSPGSGS